ncbi:Metallo-dependent phosphatase-like protein [Desarmillaria tabescens]|uniref:Metallo-dependent phosphatase-like protein n=1 Tax=Armillaria tabescens TaxID=1929756 RepID=A0AA39T7F3_ARMTA|nr:Metallo-dependent phosphatase-like protein [Desarmillaria tabescens]KAK0469706.1 Metallo-dependent phosphatase-like protein [Desarmillaria tabescens]
MRLQYFFFYLFVSLANSASTQTKGPPKAFTRHIIAIGDLHGDLKAAQDVLQLAGVTDESNNWSGDVDILVQTGDIIDRGPDATEIFQLMEKLRRQADSHSGTVVSLLGNHEWMNILGDWRYVPSKEMNTDKVIKERQHLLTKGWLGQAWKNYYKSAVRLPLHPSVGDTSGGTRYSPVTSSSGALSHSAISFVHGGLSPTFRCLLPFPTHINSLSDTLLKRAFNQDPQPTPYPPARSFPQLDGTTSNECQLTADDGPLWYRDWALNSEKEVCAKVDAVLKNTGTRRMVMGHTIQEVTEITARCDGKILLIDTGMSSAYNDGKTGLLSALSIYYTLSPIGRSANPKTQRWKEHEVISAFYADEEEITMIDETREVAGDFSVS